MNKIYLTYVKQLLLFSAILLFSTKPIFAQFNGGNGDGYASGISPALNITSLPPAAPVTFTATSIDEDGFISTWNTNASATNYYLDVDDNSDFSSPVSSYNNLEAGNTTSYEISGLAPNRLYFFRVRAFNAYGTSNNSNTISLNTLQKELSITGISISNKTYDGNTTASITGTAELVGVYGSESVSLVSIGALAVFDTKNIGTGKAVSISGYTIEGTDAGNYSLTQPAGFTANITAKELTITGISISNKIYNGNTDATISGTAALNGIIGSESVSLVSTGALAAFDTKNIGTGKAVSISGYTIEGTDAGNYSLTQPAGFTADITAKELTITGISISNKIYNGNTDASISGTAALNGIIGSESVSLVSTGALAAFDTKNIGTGKAVSISGYTIEGTDAGNYSLTQPAGFTADITAKELTINGISISNKIYNGNTDATISGTAALNGIVDSESVSLVSTGALAAFDTKNIGTGKSVSISGYTIEGTDAGNYSLTQPTGFTADITAKELTITGISISNKIYNGNTDATISGTSALNGIVDSESVSLVSTGALAAFDTKNIGTGKAVNISGYTIEGTDAGNYSLTQPAGFTANITAKELTITGISISNKIYNGNTDATISGTAALNGIIGSESVSLITTGALAAFDTKNIGTGKAVSISGYTIEGTDAGNYSLTQPAGFTANITAKELTITGISISNKIYNGNTDATISGTAALNGIVGSESVSLITTGALAAFDTKNIGTGKAVNISGYTIEGTDAGNYSLTQPAGFTANITAKELTITGISISNKIYNGNTDATISGTAALNGIVDSESVSLITTGALAAFDTKNIGTGKAVNISGYTIEGTDAGNYSLTQPAGFTANITAKELTITGISISNKIYNGNTDATISGTAALNGIVDSESVSLVSTGALAAFDTKNIGTGKAVNISGYTIEGTDAGNYSLTQPAGFTADITAKELTISGMTVQNKVYDGTTDASLGGGVLEGVLEGEDVALVSGSASFEDANAGTGKTVTLTGFSLSGIDAGNYTLSQPSGLTADIEKANPVISWENPADIEKGTALSSTQLNATADIGGTFIYTPELGTILNVGNNQELKVDFTPTDQTNYNQASKTVYINVTPATGIDEPGKRTISLYPNPSRGDVYLTGLHTFEGKQPLSLSILDFNGKTVYTKEIQNPSEKELIDLRSLVPGIYFIRIQNATASILIRIVRN